MSVPLKRIPIVVPPEKLTLPRLGIVWEPIFVFADGCSIICGPVGPISPPAPVVPVGLPGPVGPVGPVGP